MHFNEPKSVVLSKKRPESAGPRRNHCVQSNKLDSNDDIIVPEKSTLDISHRVSNARVAQGYKTRKELAKSLNIPVDIINNIESRKGSIDKQILNKVCQFLKIKST